LKIIEWKYTKFADGVNEKLLSLYKF
jgi:hypothetical protein